MLLDKELLIMLQEELKVKIHLIKKMEKQDEEFTDCIKGLKIVWLTYLVLSK